MDAGRGGRLSVAGGAAGRALDPFVLEIVADAFVAVCDEMFVTTQRTSQSTIVYEVLDFAVGLTDAEGNLITQGNGVPFFLGVIDQAVRAALAKFGPCGLYEGDVVLTNDPYESGTHLSDVTVMTPIFHRGDLVAFAANKAHWIDVGGKDPGSVSPDASEIFQEGLQLPCVKAFERGEPVESVLDLVAANVRTPSSSVGDLHAQVASVRLAARRFDELCARHGLETIRAAIEHMAEHEARLVALELARLPAGTYTAEDWIEDDGTGGGPFPLRVAVTVGPDALVCDFGGTHPQLASPVNCSASALLSAARVVFKAITAPSTPVSEGSFRALRVLCPPGTVFSAERPAAVSAYYEVLPRVTDLVWKALAPVLPERLSAGHFASVCADLVVGEHPGSGELFILFEPSAGGWGAARGADGACGTFCISDGDTYSIPVEVAETKYGVLVDRYALNVTGAGAGRWRGGEGIVRDYRITAERATASGIFSRHAVAPWGGAGGRDGSRNELQVLAPDGRVLAASGVLARFPVERGGVVRILTGTGGGWGDPLERDPAAVAADVRNGLVTAEQAERVYGVTVDPERFVVRGLSAERCA